MNQAKIGMFISNLRKEKGLTQAALAEMLSITDRAVSKWERGLSLPDSSIMLPLCEILGINVNELLTGERINMENYNKKSDELLIEMTRMKEQRDKELLFVEIFLGITISIVMGACIMIAALVNMSTAWRIVLITIGIILFAIGILYCLRIEQIAGYYECQKCHHKFIPTFNQVLFAMHVNRTRYMKCPKCHKKSWCRKKISDK
ncbi:MAG: helix-turn-helix domain-containing protein [Oscillospiraceae bacterium]|nr:helix-turn-helix domain-containing protein [Oscillospiraceae bacterium]